MSTIIFSPESRTTVRWTSGTSTEMFIHPADGSFAERRFVFRISTATVEAEESTFTFFEGITRHLMILKGELELIHEDRYTKPLKPYDQDTFSGEWSTRSRGRVTDFNLMLKDGATGSLTHHRLSHGNPATFIADDGPCFVYVASGSVVLGDGGVAKAGDLIQVMGELRLTAEAEADLVLVRAVLTPVFP